VSNENNRAFVVITDITERKQAEKKILETERLSAIGEMSSGVAHDFNNSLQVILGNLQMAMLVPGIPSEATEFVEAALKSAGDATARVRQLQRFTKKSSTMEHTTLNLTTLIDDIIFQTKPIWKNDAEKKGLSIGIQKTYGETPSVDGNAGELSSVFHNLIKNAVEAMPHGGKITVETGVRGREVFACISDTGIGMSEDTQKRIFQPFFSTKGLEPGRGLGMSAVYATIKDHGGTIAVVRTEVGKGSTIEVKLPMGIKHHAVSKQATIESYQISARVLWVDDEPDIRKLGKRILERLGHFVETAGSGREALELLKTNQYDLLVTDIGMPGMSGWQLAEAVKGKHGAMKVAIVTGWGADVSSEEKIKHGIGYVLGKPTTIEEIRNLVGEVLQSKMK
jgi:CheY-like chemotaxis protein